MARHAEIRQKRVAKIAPRYDLTRRDGCECRDEVFTRLAEIVADDVGLAFQDRRAYNSPIRRIIIRT